MPRLTRLLKVSVIGLFVVTGLAACHPTYVRESYHEPHFPTYAPVSTYSRAPAYSVQYYSSAPSYEERRTIVVPRVVVKPPSVVFSANHPQHAQDSRRENRHIGDRNDDRRERLASVDHPKRTESSANQIQAIRGNRGGASELAHR
jgi:hypothetical protein